MFFFDVAHPVCHFSGEDAVPETFSPGV
jgi:hypothetical protein